MAKKPPGEVAKIRKAIRGFFDTIDPSTGCKIGSAKCGVYIFYDYEDEPIYVGQSVESLRGRVGRHLTGRRSDAVGKYVLDPFEVLSIEVWPMFDLEKKGKAQKKAAVDAAEYQVFKQALKRSEFNAILNEGEIPRPSSKITLPASWKGKIIPDDLYDERRHPDVRLARRAQTFASLARLISERAVNDDIRRTLLVQAKRLEFLADRRLNEA
jgi:GIY-YIG catalytic domain